MGPITVVAVETLFDQRKVGAGDERLLYYRGTIQLYLWDPMTSQTEIQLNKLAELEKKLITVLSKTADTLDSITTLSTSAQANSLANKQPEEFTNLLKEIREEFFEIIENTPKPGIPYYDPKPLTDLKNSTAMTE